MKSKFRAINGNHHAINNKLSSEMLKKKVEEVHGLRITVQENRFEAEEDDDSWNPSPEIKDTSSPLHRITLRNNRISREFNMAAITARSGKKRVSYHDLHNLSTTDLLFDEKKKKRRPTSKSLGFFEAER